MSDVNKSSASGDTGDKLDPRIDAIKEIIFGENIKQYNKEFNQLKDLIRKYKADHQQRLKDLRQELKTLIGELDQNLSKQLADMKKETLRDLNNLNEKKVNRKLLGELLEELGKKIRS